VIDTFAQRVMPALKERPTKLKPGQSVPVLYRSFEIDQRKVNREERTVEICFATETPADRYFGEEILLCGAENVRLSRLNNKGAFLFEHDVKKQIGAHVPGSVRMDPDRKGRALIKFSRSNLGEEQWQDVQDGIRTLISVGYIVHKYEVDEEEDTFTATDWEPLENSLVSIPVDTACGVGRSAGNEVSTTPKLTRHERRMKETDNPDPEPEPQPPPPPPPKQTKFDRDIETKKLREKLVEDQNKIRELGRRFEMFGGEEKMEDAIKRGITPQQFQNELVESFDPEAIRPQPGDHQTDGRSRITVEYEPPGFAFSNSPDYRRSVKFGTIRQPISVELPRASVRATITSTGLTSFSRPPGVVELGAQKLTVRDLCAQGTTNASTVRYPREVAIPTFSGALTTAEDAAKKETTWSLAEVDAPVRKIAVIGRVSEEAYSDQSFLQSYIDNRLRFLVQTQEENQLLTGNGVAPNLQGIMTTSGIQTISGATGTTGDNIMIAITNVRSVGFYEPDGIVLHPTDYRKLRLAKDANNQYFGGGYFMNQYGVGPVQMQPQIWGIPTVVTTAITAGTILVGAFKLGAQIFDREGLRVDTTETDGSDWASNRIAVRVEERLTLAVYRPLAFCTVTAIP
jgi:HK97 family phage major capsid protein/HK97 family phage prohead protease